MATKKEWARGYLEQACEDIAAVEALSHDRCVAPSVLLMLIQMVYEKLSKASLLALGRVEINDVLSTHVAASRFMKLLERDSDILNKIFSNKPSIFWTLRLYIIDIESLQPQIAKHLREKHTNRSFGQLEYPWENQSIQWPAQHLRQAQELRDPYNRKLVDLIKMVCILSSWLKLVI